jgi:ubiquinone/menaquinone biosynthesis C-methylase UbiE
MSDHKFWHHMDETERRKWQNPEAVLKQIGLKPGLTFMDIGCGEGFFTFPAARSIGPGGRVYGLDLDEVSIEEIDKRAAAEGLDNLELRVGAAENTIFCQSCADIVFFGIVLHDFKDPGKVLQNARQMLKRGGKLANLDWKKQSMSFGPPVSIRFDENTAARLIESAGFNIESVTDSGLYHYLLIARPARL